MRLQWEIILAPAYRRQGRHVSSCDNRVIARVSQEGGAMTVRYVVTMEFAMGPPVTHRGTVMAASVSTCVARATREAMKAHPHRKWSSLVCVLVERLDDQSETEREPAEVEGDDERA